MDIAGDKTSIIVVGSSGHAQALADAVEAAGAFRIVGYLDDTAAAGTPRGNYSVLGPIAEGAALFARHQVAHAVIAVGDNWSRRKIYSDLTKILPDLRFPVVRHPSAVISPYAQIAHGTAILAGAHVGPSSRVGAFCILNTSSSIDHDCVMHGFSSLAPGAITGGHVKIGECSAIGVGAAISDRISIGNHTVVGTGSVVVRDISDLVVAYGNPARVMRPRSEDESYIG